MEGFGIHINVAPGEGGGTCEVVTFIFNFTKETKHYPPTYFNLKQGLFPDLTPQQHHHQALVRVEFY